MDEYISHYDSYDKTVVYNFVLGEGGIGDYIKFFSYLLYFCIKHKIKVKHLMNDTCILKYIKLNYENMYIDSSEIDKEKISTFEYVIPNEEELINIDSSNIYFIRPNNLYGIFSINEINIKISDIFHFSNDVIDNSYKLTTCQNYLSIHIRLGDEFLETDHKFIQSGGDRRDYNLENIYRCIENNSDKQIMLFCDSLSFKLMIKQRYDYINITNAEIGHTSLFNTTEKQMLDGITEFYLLTKSQKIYAGSRSGFSEIAAKFYDVYRESI